MTPYPAAVVAGLEGDRQQALALQALDWMPEAPDHFAADPFVTFRPQRPSDILVFYELFPWKSARGVIACAPYSPDGFGKHSIVLDTPYHLSYPFTLHRDGKLAIIPEHAASKHLRRYDMSDSGAVVGEETIGRDLALLDCTFVEWQGRHWMFATHPGPAENAELHLYHSDSMDGPWRPHPANPVVRDLGAARPAGQFILHRGGLFRPAQDCRANYGAGIVVNEITCLTPDRFEETAVSEIRMPSGSVYDYGLHTISSIGTLTAIDGARMESTISHRLNALAPIVRALAK